MLTVFYVFYNIWIIKIQAFFIASLSRLKNFITWVGLWDIILIDVITIYCYVYMPLSGIRKLDSDEVQDFPSIVYGTLFESF